MRKYRVSCLALAILFLASTPCMAKVMDDPRQQAEITALYESLSQDQTARIVASKSKPQDLNDTEIARLSAEAVSILGHQDYPETPVVKWTDELRVVVQNAQGQDVDLTKFPGKEIKQYLDDLSAFTGKAIRITPTGKQDNNVSIVIGDLAEKYDPSQYDALAKNNGLSRETIKEIEADRVTPDDPHVGAILGRPELSPGERILGNLKMDAIDLTYIMRLPPEEREQRRNNYHAWESHTYRSYANFLHDEAFGTYRVRTTIVACLLLMPAIAKYPQYYSSNYVLSYMNRIMPRCLGFRGVPVPMIKQKVDFNIHALYALKFLYNDAIKPGMSAEAAEAVYREIISGTK